MYELMIRCGYCADYNIPGVKRCPACMRESDPDET